MKTVKKLIAFTAALITAAVTSFPLHADDIAVEIIPETGDTEIVISPDKAQTKISPYIYGINDKGDISSISPTVIKQTGTALSTYNWETNYSNAGKKGMNSNDMSLVSAYSSGNWGKPALNADYVYARGRSRNIPVRLVTLQMLGYAAKDSMGIVSDDELSRNTRWCTVSFNKNDAFLNQPDTFDDVVYIDEYVSYLVNRYGSASDGGINGYFLDSEPDLWADNFSVLDIPKITPEELVERSAELSSVIKTLDGQAFVFGPSLSGLQGCINLNNADAWNNSASGNEYSWFIDYYLSEMRRKGEETGHRLLDVLDIHYYTEAMTPVGVPVLTGTDEYSRAYRMQSVKTLWDPEYTENSVTVLMNKQFTPVIPTLQASIRINYPGTRLSFSEYDFGGGDDISGAIAQIDALGTFAKEEVYLACLSPVSEDYSFQKAAFRLFTDYDGNGSGLGDMLVCSDNGGDPMSSVIAASDSGDPEALRVIVTNKNLVNMKNFTISVNSAKVSYELEEAYTIDKENARIIPADTEMFDTSEDGFISFEADTCSVYMLVLSGSESEQLHEDTETSVPDNVWESTASESDITDTDTETQTEGSETEATVSETETVTGTEPTPAVNPADETVHDLTESAVTTVSVTETVTVSESQTEHTEESEADESESVSETEIHVDDDRKVAAPVKIIVSILAATVGLGVVYILIFDKK